MGWRFSRRLRVLPGVRLNISKSGVSTSVGGRGAWFTFGKRGTRTTVGITGTGLSYTATSPKSRPTQGVHSKELPPERGSAVRGWLWIVLFLAVIAAIGLSSCSDRRQNAPTQKELFDMESACGANARDWMARIRGFGSTTADHPFEFASHFNRKLGRCFVSEVQYIRMAKGMDVVSQLVDVNANAVVGVHMTDPGSQLPARCDVEEKRCASSKEWADLVRPYMHD